MGTFLCCDGLFRVLRRLANRLAKLDFSLNLSKIESRFKKTCKLSLFYLTLNTWFKRQVFSWCRYVLKLSCLCHLFWFQCADSHDMVLRFNNAPTENYTDDVGSKTTFRILNSQVSWLSSLIKDFIQFSM